MTKQWSFWSALDFMLIFIISLLHRLSSLQLHLDPLELQYSHRDSMDIAELQEPSGREREMERKLVISFPLLNYHWKESKKHPFLNSISCSRAKAAVAAKTEEKLDDGNNKVRSQVYLQQVPKWNCEIRIQTSSWFRLFLESLRINYHRRPREREGDEEEEKTKRSPTVVGENKKSQ